MSNRTKYLRVITDDQFTKRIQAVAKSQGKSVSRFARDVLEQTIMSIEVAISIFEEKFPEDKITIETKCDLGTVKITAEKPAPGSKSWSKALFEEELDKDLPLLHDDPAELGHEVSTHDDSDEYDMGDYGRLDGDG